MRKWNWQTCLLRFFLFSSDNAVQMSLSNFFPSATHPWCNFNSVSSFKHRINAVHFFFHAFVMDKNELMMADILTNRRIFCKSKRFFVLYAVSLFVRFFFFVWSVKPVYWWIIHCPSNCICLFLKPKTKSYKT